MRAAVAAAAASKPASLPPLSSFWCVRAGGRAACDGPSRARVWCSGPDRATRWRMGGGLWAWQDSGGPAFGVPQLASSHAQPQHRRHAAASFGVERGARVSLPVGGLRAQRMTHVTWLSCGSRVATTQARSPRDDDGDDYEPEIKVSGVVVVGGSGNGEEDLPALGVHWLFYAGISDASSLSLVDIPATSFAAVHHNNCTGVLVRVCMRCAYDHLGVCACVYVPALLSL